MPEPTRTDGAARVRKFTVEGRPLDVFAFVEAADLKIVHPRWWQRTYAVPRWLVWFAVANALLNIVRWFA